MSDLSVPVKHLLNRCEFVESGRARVIRQLLEATIFEGLLDCIAVPADGGAKQSKIFYFSVGGFSYSCPGRLRYFNRIALDVSRLIEISLGRKRPLAEFGSAQLIEALITEISVSQKAAARLCEELEQSANWEDWNNKHLSRPNSKNGLCHDRIESSYLLGHPYHPCFRSRSGFSLSDHRSYSSESGQSFQLHWLAVPSELCDWQLPCKEKDAVADENCLSWSCSKLEANTPDGSVKLANHRTAINSEFFIGELGQDICLELNMRLAFKQGNRQEADSTQLNAQEKNGQKKLESRASGQRQNFIFIPVHPWQYQNVWLKQWAHVMFDQGVVDLGVCGDRYVASQSLRTLLNVSNPLKSNLKLPLNIASSSSKRSLLRHGVCSAPLISDWLQETLQSDPFFDEYPLILLKEYAGMRLKEELFGGDPQRSQIGVVYRESINAYLETSQQAISLSALLNYSSDNRPLIDAWLSEYDLEAWLAQLIRVSFTPVLHLLVEHGLAIEAHGQNSLVVFEDGWPVACAQRDFHESLEYCRAFLKRPKLEPNFELQDPIYRGAADDEYYWMSSIEALRELFMDTVLVYNYSDIANFMEVNYGFKEDQFWGLVRAEFKRYQLDRPESAQRIEKLGLTKACITVESLLTHKVSADNNIECRHWVKNDGLSFLEKCND